MRATLEFDLSTEEGKAEYKLAVTASKVWRAVNEFDKYLEDQLARELIHAPVYLALYFAKLKLRSKIRENISEECFE
jgi:hypothetical protein